MTTRECCLGCGKSGAAHVCTGCHVARYCDDECAEAGWKASHAVACKHFNAFGGKKKLFEFTAGYIWFLRALTTLRRKRRGQLHTNASTLCDEIIQIVHSCLPDYDLNAIDTLSWHASVKQDLVDHAGDTRYIRYSAEVEQLYRNLPAAIDKLFENEGERITSEIRDAAGNARVNSAIELDRSRLTLLPYDVQVMLFENLPAYSILAVIENLPDASKKAVLLRLLDRDIFSPMARSEMPLRAFLANMEKNRQAFENLSYVKLREEYDHVTNSVATALINNATLPMGSPERRASELSAMKAADVMVLEGRHFALEFRHNRETKQNGWMVHPIVSKRFFKILPNELAVAIRDFSSGSRPAYITAAPFSTLIKLVVQRIDPSVGWRIPLSPFHIWPKFIWPPITSPYGSGSAYEAPLDTVVSGPGTAYRLVAERTSNLESATRTRANPSTMLERLMD